MNKTSEIAKNIANVFIDVAFLIVLILGVAIAMPFIVPSFVFECIKMGWDKGRDLFLAVDKEVERRSNG